MGLDTTIFGTKTVSDVLKEIYDNSRSKAKQVNALIGELKPLVENIGDATLVVPLITTLAPGKPSLASSTTVPEIFVCPITVATQKKSAANNKFLKFFIVEF